VPTKATWLRFETDSSFNFDFFLAAKLGMTVEEMRRRVSAEEWMQWGVYYGRLAQQRELAMRGR
jgi:hypothetical protein